MLVVDYIKHLIRDGSRISSAFFDKLGTLVQRNFELVFRIGSQSDSTENCFLILD